MTYSFPTRRSSVLPRFGSCLVGQLIGCMVGPAMARRSSFRFEALGEALFDSGVTIIDDPLRLRGLRSRPFDGEGLPVERRALTDRGVLTGWLLDSAPARQLGLQPTGHASRGGSGDRKRVVSGKSVSVRVDLGGRRIIQQTKQQQVTHKTERN